LLLNGFHAEPEVNKNTGRGFAQGDALSNFLIEANFWKREKIVVIENCIKTADFYLISSICYVSLSVEAFKQLEKI
jgi:hypothetical protein